MDFGTNPFQTQYYISINVRKNLSSCINFLNKIYIENCSRQWMFNDKAILWMILKELFSMQWVYVVSSKKENNRQQSKTVTEKVDWIYSEELRKSLNKKTVFKLRLQRIQGVKPQEELSNSRNKLSHISRFRRVRLSTIIYTYCQHIHHPIIKLLHKL